MECLTPVYVRNEKYNGIDGGYKYHKVPCGKCPNCLRNKRSEWLTRLLVHCEKNPPSYFVTLTYDNQNVPINDKGILEVNKRDVQLFFKRLRKEYPFHISYYCGAEYGSHTSRPHYHAIVCGLPNDPDTAYRLLTDTWKKGNVNIGSVTPASINYVCKYFVVRSQPVPDGAADVFNLISKGLSLSCCEDREFSYLNKPNSKKVIFQYGQEFKVPRYISEHVLNSETKQRFKSQFEDFYNSQQLPKSFKYLRQCQQHSIDKMYNTINQNQKF